MENTINSVARMEHSKNNKMILLSLSLLANFDWHLIMERKCCSTSLEENFRVYSTISSLLDPDLHSSFENSL